MLTKCDFHNIDGSHTYSLNSDTSPLKLFDISVEQRTVTDRPKSQQHGRYPTNTLRGGMTIHCEGSIFGDTSALYWAERKSMLVALFGTPTLTPTLTDRKLGYLQVGFAGESEDWVVDATISAFSAPITALFPGSTDYLVTFECWDAWFHGATTPTNLYYAA